MKKIKFSSFFKFKLAVPILILFAIIQSSWSSSLIMVINNKISGTKLPFLEDLDLEVYVFFLVTSFLITYFFKRYMLRSTLIFGKKILLDLLNKLRLLGYESYLRVGEAKVRTALNDIKTIERFPEVFISSLTALITIFVTVSYMFWLYPKGAVTILLLIFILCYVFLLRNKAIAKNIKAERNLEDGFMHCYNDFLDGFHMIKMSTVRNNTLYYDYLSENRDKSLKFKIKSQLGTLGNNLIGEYSLYFLIGVILFVLPMTFVVDQKIIAGFMVTVLFLIGPLSNFIQFMNILIGYREAFSRLNEINEITSDNFDGHDISTNKNSMPPFEKLSIIDVGYNYMDDQKNIVFSLKSINLVIKKGEVLFIRGGNGSGKSTFMKLLCGLFSPESGRIYYNNTLITDKNRSDYRDMLSCIFSNNHLFTENYNKFNLLPSNTKFINLLKEMELDQIIKPDKSKNKISGKLSSGQKKRLALIFSILEDKEIYIFDEWAAEQDPKFRKYFYEEIIPKLKDNGKTVIAITHDDAYFQFSDRLIEFDYGKISDSRQLVS